MNRDDALFIARRVMDRNREDGAEHLDSIADEILAGEAIIEGKRKPFVVDVVDVSNLEIEPPQQYVIGQKMLKLEGGVLTTFLWNGSGWIKA